MPEYVKEWVLNAHSFTYPGDRLLMLKGTIPDEEKRQPTALDQSNEPYFMVIKCGNTTGLAVACANDLCSYTRSHYDGDKAATFKKWPSCRSTPSPAPFRPRSPRSRLTGWPCDYSRYRHS